MPFTLRMSDETRRKWRVFRQNRRGFASLLHPGDTARAQPVR